MNAIFDAFIPLTLPFCTMKKLINLRTIFLLIAASLTTTNSFAETFTLNFSASNFTSAYYGTTPPQNLLTGAITFDASSLGAEISAIRTVQFSVDGHVYHPTDISGYSMGGGGYFFGGVLNGANSIAWGTNDFYLVAFNGLQNLIYSSTSQFDGWSTANVSFNYATSPVPEPSSVAMMLIGLAALSRLRKHASTKNTCA
jgi:PEP-CTERM motif